MAQAPVIKAQLQGAAEVMARLKALGATKANKAARKAVSKADQIVLKEAKALTSKKRTGTLRRSLGRKEKTYPGSVTVGIVGPRKGFRGTYLGKPIDPVKYGHLAEKGRKAVAVVKKKALSSGKDGGMIFGKRVSAYIGRRFLQRAWARTKAPAEAAVAKTLAEELTKLTP